MTRCGKFFLKLSFFFVDATQSQAVQSCVATLGMGIAC